MPKSTFHVNMLIKNLFIHVGQRRNLLLFSFRLGENIYSIDTIVELFINFYNSMSWAVFDRMFRLIDMIMFSFDSELAHFLTLLINPTQKHVPSCTSTWGGWITCQK